MPGNNHVGPQASVDATLLLANLGMRAGGSHAGGTPALPATREFASSIMHLQRQAEIMLHVRNLCRYLHQLGAEHP